MSDKLAAPKKKAPPRPSNAPPRRPTKAAPPRPSTTAPRRVSKIMDGPKCSKCGANWNTFKPGSKFCGSCGAKRTEQPTSASSITTGHGGKETKTSVTAPAVKPVVPTTAPPPVSTTTSSSRVPPPVKKKKQILGKQCSGCLQAIEGRHYAPAPDLLFHQNCYKCSICKDSLNGQSWFGPEDGKIFCERCYLVKRNPICGQCRSPIEGEYTEFKGEKYHVKHLACSNCKSLLMQQKVYDWQGQAHCSACYIKRGAPKCAECDEGLLGDIVQGQDGMSFHPKCFCCIMEHPLKPLDPFYHYSDGKYCVKHFEELILPSCQECELPIKGEYVKTTSDPPLDFHSECWNGKKAREGSKHNGAAVEVQEGKDFKLDKAHRKKDRSAIASSVKVMEKANATRYNRLADSLMDEKDLHEWASSHGLTLDAKLITDEELVMAISSSKLSHHRTRSDSDKSNAAADKTFLNEVSAIKKAQSAALTMSLTCKEAKCNRAAAASSLYCPIHRTADTIPEDAEVFLSREATMSVAMPQLSRVANANKPSPKAALHHHASSAQFVGNSKVMRQQAPKIKYDRYGADGTDETLCAAITIPQIRMHLTQFLRKSFALENMMFLRVCRAYQALSKRSTAMSESDKILAARVVWLMYLDPGKAIYEVNCPSDQLRDTRSSLQQSIMVNKYDAHMFDRCYREIYEMTNRDVFSRFIGDEKMNVRLENPPSLEEYHEHMSSRLTFIHVHAKLDYSSLDATVAALANSGLCDAHWFHLKRYKNCIKGRRLVQWLLDTSQCKSVARAVFLCQTLMEASLLLPVAAGSAPFFTPDNSLYRAQEASNVGKGWPPIGMLGNDSKNINGNLVLRGAGYHDVWAILSFNTQKLFTYRQEKDSRLQAPHSAYNLKGASVTIHRSQASANSPAKKMVSYTGASINPFCTYMSFTFADDTEAWFILEGNEAEHAANAWMKIFTTMGLKVVMLQHKTDLY